MDPTTAADEKVKKLLFEEYRYLEMENKAHREKNLNLCLIMFDRCMELMVIRLKAKLELTKEEILSTLFKEYDDWQKATPSDDECGTPMKEDDPFTNFGSTLFRLACRLCWEYIQIHHPEKGDCQLVSTVKIANPSDDGLWGGLPIIEFVPKVEETKITPKE